MEISVSELVVEIADNAYKIKYWVPEMSLNEPGNETFVGVDTETEEIIPGALTIPVILQVCYPSQRLVHIIKAEHMQTYLERMLAKNPSLELIFHSAPFDLNVLGFSKEHILFKHLEKGKIIDISIRYILTALDVGSYINTYNLAFISKEILGENLDKGAGVRLTFKAFGELTDNHLVYAATDAIVTALLRAALPVKQATEDWQLKGYIALNNISDNGMLVDKEYVVALRNKLNERKDTHLEILNTFGWYPGLSGNNAVLQEVLANMEDRIGVKFPKTPKNKEISLTDELLQSFEGNVHPFITAYKEYKHIEKLIETYLGDDLIGVDGRVHPHFNPLVLTGRTSCARPNLQNIPKGDDIRGIYTAPPKNYLLSVDYSQLELCALAEHCLKYFGQSKMAELINADIDLHSWFGDEIIKAEGKDPLNCTEEDRKFHRQLAKSCGFGYPGGLGPDTFTSFAKGYGLNIDRDKALELKKIWLNTFPEMTQHLRPKLDIMWTENYIKRFIYKHMKEFKNQKEASRIVKLEELDWFLENEGRSPRERDGARFSVQMYMANTVTGRVKRNCTYCAACNYPSNEADIKWGEFGESL